MMNLKRVAEVAGVVLLTCAILVGLSITVATLVAPRFSVGGPFGPPIELGVWYQFMGRPRPEEPAVIIRFMLMDDSSRPGKALLNIRNYLRYGICVDIHIYIYGQGTEVIASGGGYFSIESKAKIDGEIGLSWTEGASLRDAKWGELRAEVTGQFWIFGFCSLARAVILPMSNTAAANVMTYDGIDRIAYGISIS